MANANLDELPAPASPTLQGPPGPFLDAFLTPYRSRLHQNQNPLALIERTEPVNVREFAETETTLGTVTVGYTDDGQLAFTFERTNEVYLVAITTVLSDLVAHLVTRRTIVTQPRPTARLM